MSDQVVDREEIEVMMWRLTDILVELRRIRILLEEDDEEEEEDEEGDQ